LKIVRNNLIDTAFCGYSDFLVMVNKEYTVTNCKLI